MKRILLGVCFALPLIADTDLAPLPETEDVEGAKLDILRFHSPKGSFRFDPPWPMRGSGDEAAFILPAEINHARCGFRIHRKTKPGEAPIGDNPVIRDWLLKKIPKEADKLVVNSVKTDGVKMNAETTCAIFYTYSLIGQPVTCVSFLAWRQKDGPELFEIYLECSSADFDKLFRPLEESLYSISGF